MACAPRDDSLCVQGSDCDCRRASTILYWAKGTEASLAPGHLLPCKAPFDADLKADCEAFWKDLLR